MDLHECSADRCLALDAMWGKSKELLKIIYRHEEEEEEEERSHDSQQPKTSNQAHSQKSFHHVTPWILSSPLGQQA